MTRRLWMPAVALTLALITASAAAGDDKIEVAYSLLKSDGPASAKDPIDAHYEKLRTSMEVLERASDEFKLLEKYVKNTHAATHTLYSLEIEQVF